MGAATFQPVASKTEEKDNYLLYLAYVINKLNSWKYKVYAHIDILPDDVWKSAPCNIDGMGVMMNALKMVKPEMYDPHKSIAWHEEAIEKYLKEQGFFR